MARGMQNSFEKPGLQTSGCKMYNAVPDLGEGLSMACPPATPTPTKESTGERKASSTSKTTPPPPPPPPNLAQSMEASLQRLNVGILKHDSKKHIHVAHSNT